MTSIWVGKKKQRPDRDYSEDLATTYTDVCYSTFNGGPLVEKTHPVPERSSTPCVSSGFGMWNEKIYHFKPDQPPSSDGDEIQSEFFVRYEDMPSAVYAIYGIADKFRHLVQITEIRGIESDNIPLSPAKGQRVFGIHFTWKRDFEGVYFAAKEVQ